MKRGSIVSYETMLRVGGSRDVLAPILERDSGLKRRRDFHLDFSPERVKSRRILERLPATPKAVSGFDAAAAEKGTPFPVTGVDLTYVEGRYRSLTCRA